MHEPTRREESKMRHFLLVMIALTGELRISNEIILTNELFVFGCKM